MANPKNKIEVVLSAVDAGLSTAFAKVNRSMLAAEGAAKSYGRSMELLQAPIRAVTGTLARLGGAFAAVFASREYLRVAEAYTGLDARLRLVTESSEEFKQVQEDLYKLSQESGTGYQENAATYTKLAVALKASGATSKELIGINEAVSKSLIVAGASAQESASFLLQFGQAMGSGVLQGDELRSMLESNSYFAQQLAAALDTDIAGLRKLGSEGKLTADIIRRAVPGMLQQINADFSKMPLTIGRAMTMLTNAFEKIVNGSNNAGGATGKLAELIRTFVVYLEANGAKIEAFVVKMIDFAGSAAKAAWEWKGFIAAFVGTSLAVSVVASLAAALKGLMAGLVALTGGAAPILAVAAAASFAVISVGRLIQHYFALRDATRELEQAQRDAKLQADFIDPKIASRLAEVNQELGTTFRTMDELFAAEKRGEVVFDEMTASWQKNSTEIAQATTTTSATMKRVQGEALEAMKKKYQEYAAEVKRLQGEIEGREMSLYQQLRNMARSGMSDASAWKDLKQEAEEYQTVAEAAAEAGDFETAIKYADLAKEAFAQLNTEVKAGDKVVVSRADALKTSMEGVKRSGEIGIEAMKALQTAAADAMENLTEASGFQDLSKGMDDAAKQWNDNWRSMREQAVKDIEEVEDRLLAIKDKEVTVWINERVKKQTGGPVGLRRGGRLPGYGGGDRISALLEAGEFVIRKEAVSKFGSGLFHALNSLKWPKVPRFALGGMVGGATAMASGGPTYNLSVSFSGETSPASRNNARSQAKMLLAELEKMQRRASA